MCIEMLAMMDVIAAPAKKIVFRRADVNDAKTIAEHRYAMFRDIGYHDTPALNLMRSRFLPWVQEKLASGDYRAWLAVTASDHVVAGVGLWLMDWPAHMVGFGERRGNILNVYTEPAFRRQGLARVLIESALQWCRTNEVDLVILHASEQGRRIYEHLGFQAGNEMRIRV